jgi:DNA repair exonuclease SbcCD ATPase subunit
VLATARQHNAGVLFLGDFWHARGALPVTVLNAVLDNLAKWDVPTLLLPGNHDQVVHGGEDHALTPLVAAKQGLFHVFTHPTIWRSALWLPYRRDADVLHACLASHAGSLGAVFAHVDVAGAQMNERHQATYGLDAHLFPPSIPTYTGHYHLPHMVPGTNITYIGSPYQVSASEAGQRKRLLLLSPTWQLEKSLPLDVGPRHFKVEGQDARLPELRKGDRIRWVLPSSGQEPRLGKLSAAIAAPPEVGELRARGVDVTLIRATAPNQVSPRIANADTKQPVELLQAYAQAARVPPAVIAAAQQLLSSLSGGSDADRASGLATASSGGVPALSRGHVAFEPTKLVIQGYGPFKSRVEYPLASRGFVVVSGKVVNDAAGDAAAALATGGGSGDSNGAGKTSLVMAALWALQGSAASSRKAEHFVNDNAAAASVRLEALLNGQPFWVERQADRKGRLKSFAYGLGDADYTGQDARLTAGTLNELLDVELLRTMCFHGQHDVERLLTSNDGDFKRALDRLVDLSVWQHAEEAAKERAKAADTAAKQLAGSQAQLSAALSSSAASLHDTQRRRDAWEEAHARDSAAASQAAERAAHGLSSAQQELHRALVTLRRTWERASPARAAAQQAEEQAMQAAAAATAEVYDATSHLALTPALSKAQDAMLRAQDLRSTASSALREAQQRASQADAAWGAAQRAASNFKGVPSRGADAHDHVLGTCDRCLQPIDARHFTEQAAALDAQAEEASRVAGVARDDLQAANLALRDAEAAVSRAETELHEMKATADAATNVARMQALDAMTEANRRATAARDVSATLNECFSLADRAGKSANRALAEVCGGVEKRAPEAASLDSDTSPLSAARAVPILEADTCEVEEWEQRLRTAGAAALAAEAALKLAASGVNPHDEVLRMLTQQQEQQQQQLDARIQELRAAQDEAALYDSVRTAFGDKGIQSYLLEGVAMELETKAAEHLHALTGGMLRLSLRSEPSATVAEPQAGDEAAGPKRRGRKAGELPSGGVTQDVVKDKMRLRILTPLILDSSDGDSAASPDAQFGEVERALEQLSGGERRRCALALAIAYAELAAHRGGLRSELLVLDEALQHLDPQGVERVCALLRSLDFKTVLLTSQAGSRAVALADSVDFVVKVSGRSEVQVADGAPAPPRLYDTDSDEEDEPGQPKEAQQTSFVASR